MTVLQVVIFLACVAAATAAQGMTGFAFALILVGLSSALRLVPLADSVNVATILGIISVGTALYGRRAALNWGILRPTSAGLVAGTAAGVALLAWLSATVVGLLQLLLGLTIIACAAVVYLRTDPLPEVSSKSAFAVYGVLSGLLGGLFAATGPPLVYHFYRQPLAVAVIRETLVAAIGLAAMLRLAMVLAGGQFSTLSLLLSMLGAPVAIGVSWWIRRHPPRWQRASVLRVVCVLLVLAGISLIVPAARSFGPATAAAAT
jgi:uncharacterized membrane protein YfcA